MPVIFKVSTMIFNLLLIWLISTVASVWFLGLLSCSKQQELCGPLNGRTIYLQLGEHGTITHRNQSIFENYVSRCGVELVTCPSCSIQISIDYLDLPQQCAENSLLNRSSENCPCGGLSLWEPSGHSAPKHLCSLAKKNVYTSSTRSVGISFDFISQNWTGSFSISFVSQRNQNFENGVVGESGFIKTPNFPSLYPRDFGIEHVISCMTDDCFVTLLFSDFLISPSSVMEFYDWDGKPLQLVSGRIGRPPPILSTGPSLIVRFFGNGGTSMGYKAKYDFIQNSTQAFKSLHTECGGEVDSLGGTIYMTGLTGLYDCIWTIQPAASISHFKTHLYLKIIEFNGEGILALRSGVTSESRLIETFANEGTSSTEHVTPISKGFYISMKSLFKPQSKLLIAYTAFAYMDCLSGIDLLCSNKRCISNHLMCDTIDNCGDNSDESGECKELDSVEQLGQLGQYWWPVRGGAGGGTGGASGALAAGGALAGAALVLAGALCRAALRPRSRPPAPHAAPLHTDHSRTIAHLLSMGELDDRDDPPMYEPPPEYNQVVKPSRPRRKQSVQRLIENDTPTRELQCEDEASIPGSSLPDGIKTHLVNSTTTPLEVYNTLVDRRMLENSQPISLETTGYNEQDLGLSLTLSTSSHRGDMQHKNLQWLSTMSNRFTNETGTSSNISAVSFETLHSSQEKIINTVPRLIKCHSQDNMLWIRNFTTIGNHDASTDFSFNGLDGNRNTFRQDSREQGATDLKQSFTHGCATEHQGSSSGTLEVQTSPKSAMKTELLSSESI